MRLNCYTHACFLTKSQLLHPLSFMLSLNICTVVVNAEAVNKKIQSLLSGEYEEDVSLAS